MKKAEMDNPGDELEEFLREEGLYEEVKAGAQKELLAEEIRRVMKLKKITTAEMARRMKTSRESIYRLLDSEQHNVMLDSLQRAASALGMTLNISLAPANNPLKRPPARAKTHGSRKQRKAA
jgi:antitoxin HicB